MKRPHWYYQHALLELRVLRLLLRHLVQLARWRLKTYLK